MGEVFGHEDAEMRPSTITLLKYNTDGKTALSGVTYQLKFVKSAVDSDTDYYRVTNDVTFGVPQAGAMMTVKRFVPIILGISVLGLLCILVFKRKKHVN